MGNHGDPCLAALLWKNCRSRWQSRFPLCPHKPELGSWLFKGPNGMGCKACHLTGVQSPYGAGALTSRLQLRAPRFAKHAGNEQHLSAVCQLTDCEACKQMLASRRDASSAPTAAAFQRVVDALTRGGGKHQIDEVCGEMSQKRSMMEWCVAEAMRMIDRAFLEEAGALCTNVDAKAEKFTVRFSAASRTLQHRRGQLGHAIHAGQKLDSVEAYVKSVETILRNFCTYGHGAPGRPRQLPLFSASLYEHLRRIHGCFNSDAERCVKLAGIELGNHGGLRNDAAALLPGTNITGEPKPNAQHIYNFTNTCKVICIMYEAKRTTYLYVKQTNEQ